MSRGITTGPCDRSGCWRERGWLQKTPGASRLGDESRGPPAFSRQDTTRREGLHPYAAYRRTLQELLPETPRRTLRRMTVLFYQAYAHVKLALQRGVLVRPDACSRCGGSGNGRIEAHHEDYDKPLDVIWLCKSCHAHADGVKRYRDPRWR